MRTITRLFAKEGATIIPLDLEQVTPGDVIFHEVSVNDPLDLIYLAEVEDTELDGKALIDLSLLFTATTLVRDCQLHMVQGKTDTALPDPESIAWKDVEACLTDKLVMGYSSPLFDPDDYSRVLRFVQVLHTTAFSFSYCMWQTPEDRNMKLRRWQLPDAAITKLDEKNPIELADCLLSVNGCISLPFMWNDELIMPDGASFIHNSSYKKMPSVTLLDFGPLGGFETIQFSSCTYTLKEPYKETSSTSIHPETSLWITLPTPLTGKTVWMVLSHSLYFTGFRQVNDTTIEITPSLLSLDTMLSKVAYHKAHYLLDTDVSKTDETIITYLNETIWKEDHFGAFFILIPTDCLTIQEVPFIRYAKNQMYFGQKHATGFLWDKKTHSVFDHTALYYESITDKYVMESDDLAYLTQTEAYRDYFSTDYFHPYFREMVQVGDPDMVVLNISRP